MSLTVTMMVLSERVARLTHQCSPRSGEWSWEQSKSANDHGDFVLWPRSRTTSRPPVGGCMLVHDLDRQPESDDPAGELGNCTKVCHSVLVARPRRERRAGRSGDALSECIPPWEPRYRLGRISLYRNPHLSPQRRHFESVLDRARTRSKRGTKPTWWPSSRLHLTHF